MYEKLVAAEKEEGDAPDLVIGGEVIERTCRRTLSDPHVVAADTVVVLPAPSFSILEKPRTKADQLGMLQDYQGSTVSVITAVTLGDFALLGGSRLAKLIANILSAVQPQIATPGYSLKSLVTSTKVRCQLSVLSIL